MYCILIEVTPLLLFFNPLPFKRMFNMFQHSVSIPVYEALRSYSPRHLPFHLSPGSYSQTVPRLILYSYHSFFCVYFPDFADDREHVIFIFLSLVYFA
jgi:hypothetical protein